MQAGRGLVWLIWPPLDILTSDDHSGKAQIETLCTQPVQDSEYLSQLVDALLGFLLDPDIEVVATFFSFWCKLKDQIVARYVNFLDFYTGCCSDPANPLPSRHGNAPSHLEPIFAQAIESVVLQTRFPGKAKVHIYHLPPSMNAV